MNFRLQLRGLSGYVFAFEVRERSLFQSCFAPLSGRAYDQYRLDFVKLQLARSKQGSHHIRRRE